MRIIDTLKKNKKNYIMSAILWLIFVIVFVMPISVGITEAIDDGMFDFGKCMEISIEYIQAPFSSFIIVFTKDYLPIFKNAILVFSGMWLFFMLYGTMRNESKSEFEKIEHGSSDWCKNGEQYKILSNKKGIILAENNYLPINKRGNTNVLVVGRFRFW